MFGLLYTLFMGAGLAVHEAKKTYTAEERRAEARRQGKKTYCANGNEYAVDSNKKVWGYIDENKCQIVAEVKSGQIIYKGESRDPDVIVQNKMKENENKLNELSKENNWNYNFKLSRDRLGYTTIEMINKNNGIIITQREQMPKIKQIVYINKYFVGYIGNKYDLYDKSIYFSSFGFSYDSNNIIEKRLENKKEDIIRNAFDRYNTLIKLNNRYIKYDEYNKLSNTEKLMILTQELTFEQWKEKYL